MTNGNDPTRAAADAVEQPNPEPKPKRRRVRKLRNGREEIFMADSILLGPTAVRLTPRDEKNPDQ